MEKETVKRELLSPAERERLESNLVPVFIHYQGQQKPQSAHILISPEQEHLTVGYNGEIGNSVSMMTWLGREIEIPIQPETKGTSLLDFIEEHADDFWTIIDGYTTEWDGNNLRGKLTDDASNMLYRLKQITRDELETVPAVYTTPADLWIDDEITAEYDPQELAEEIIEWKQGEGAVLQFDIEDLVEYITERQKELFSEDE